MHYPYTIVELFPGGRAEVVAGYTTFDEAYVAVKKLNGEDHQHRYRVRNEVTMEYEAGRPNSTGAV